MALDAIERFSGPPLAERAFICDQARACVVRPGSRDLESLVATDLDGDARDGLVWDSWRRADGRWTVIATVGEASPVSTWVYDPRSRSVQPEDAASHRLASEDVVVPMTAARKSHATATIEREAAPEQQPVPDVPADATPEPHPISTDEMPAPDSDQTDDEKPPASPRAKSRKGKRASVPRWDEILFGAEQSDS